MWRRNKKSERLCLIPAERIESAPLPVRGHPDEGLFRLAQSIGRYGLLQPLTVRRRGHGYELVLGERRLRAARLVGLERIPCRVVEISARAAAELRLIENSLREAPDPFEEAAACERLIRLYRYEPRQLALRLGISESTLAGKLRLLKMSPEERCLVREQALTERQARAVNRLSDRATRLFALKFLGEKGYSERQTEQLVEGLMGQNGEGAIPLSTSAAAPVRRFVVKDVRLFCNSVDRALDGIREAGIDLAAEKEEGESFISYSIRIPKLTGR